MADIHRTSDSACTDAASRPRDRRTHRLGADSKQNHGSQRAPGIKRSVWGRYIRTPLYPLTAVVALLLFWQFVIAAGLIHVGIPTQYLGSPTGIWQQFVDLAEHGYGTSSLQANILASVLRVLMGFLVGAMIAVPLGLFMGYYLSIGNLLGPIFAFLRPIPALAFIPVAVIWFGIGETGKVAVIAATSFLYTVLSSSAGVLTVQGEYLKTAKNYRVSGRRTLFSVVLPAAAPQIVTGLRTALAISWAVVVAAELIAAQKGLGFIISDASTFFKINTVYVGIIFIGLIGIAMDFAFILVGRRVLHWVGK